MYRTVSFLVGRTAVLIWNPTLFIWEKGLPQFSTGWRSLSRIELSVEKTVPRIAATLHHCVEAVMTWGSCDHWQDILSDCGAKIFKENSVTQFEFWRPQNVR